MALKYFLILSFAALAFCRVNHQSWKRAEINSNDLDIFQTLECHEEKGVCAPEANCHKDFLHPSEDLCDRNQGLRCCLTTTPQSKKVIQMPGCANMNSICTWDHLCKEENRHENTLLCGGQDNVLCCKVEEEEQEEPIENTKRVVTASETRPPCVTEGGMCIIDGRCDDIIQQEVNKLCWSQNAKCCVPKDHQLVRDINLDAPVKRDEEYIPISEKRSDADDALVLRGDITRLGSGCGDNGGECRLLQECGNGFTDNAASCGQNNLVCCIFTRVVA